MPAGDGARDDLSRYVREYIREQSSSLRRLAVRAIDPETTQRLDYQWLGTLTSPSGGLRRAPEPWQLRALAAALDVPDDVIKALAARQWLDYEVAQARLGPQEWAMFLQVRNLPEEDQETLRDLVKRFVRRQEQLENADSADDARA
jgi:hypothetical protein